jgi:hypothetical protein
MAGSLRWFNYVLDDGSNCGVFLDESNTEQINGGAANIPPVGTRPTRQRPNGTRLRYILYKSTDGNRAIKCVALNPTIYGAIPASFATLPNPLPPTTGPGSGQLVFWDKIPERTRPPRFGADTGITDGDSPA